MVMASPFLGPTPVSTVTCSCFSARPSACISQATASSCLFSDGLLKLILSLSRAPPWCCSPRHSQPTAHHHLVSPCSMRSLALCLYFVLVNGRPEVSRERGGGHNRSSALSSCPALCWQRPSSAEATAPARRLSPTVASTDAASACPHFGRQPPFGHPGLRREWLPGGASPSVSSAQVVP